MLFGVFRLVMIRRQSGTALGTLGPQYITEVAKVPIIASLG
jgi:hypothetical protein